MVCVLLAPVDTFPKATLVGMTEMDGCTPVPLSEIVAGEPVAVLTTVTLPETPPTAAGAKFTARDKLCAGASVAAPEKPLTLNPVPA